MTCAIIAGHLMVLGSLKTRLKSELRTRGIINSSVKATGVTI